MILTRFFVLDDGKISLDGSLDKLLGCTFEFHQFQIEFENLPDDLFQKLSKLPNTLSFELKSFNHFGNFEL